LADWRLPHIGTTKGGGPSQVDSFDPKPELEKLAGKAVPESVAKDIPKIPRAHLSNVYGSPFKFKEYGQSGLAVSDRFPLTAQHADELCVVRSMKHDSPIHTPAEYIATTGTSIGNRPSLGSWVTYGPGSENNDLPGVCRAHLRLVERQKAAGLVGRFSAGAVSRHRSGAEDRHLAPSFARRCEQRRPTRAA
jgi:hypothetical protein